MKISNVLQFLETQKKDHGDLNVLLLNEKSEKSNLDFFVVSVAEEAGGNKFVMICSREKARELDAKQNQGASAAEESKED